MNLSNEILRHPKLHQRFSHTMHSHFSARFPRLALQRGLTSRFHQARSYHVAKAQFVTISEKGIPTPSETEIRIGDPHQAFIYIEPSLGDTIKSTVMQQTGLGSTQDLKKLPMVFHHTSRHFSHSLFPLRSHHPFLSDRLAETQ